MGGIVTSVDVRAHQQNTLTFCGMATAMMVLNSLDRTNPRTEVFLRHQIPATGASNAPPASMAGAISTLKPTSNSLTFTASTFPTWLAANDAIVRTLFDHQVPVATQVFGESHWLVVCAVRTDVEPAVGTQYTLEGVFVNNPTPTPTGNRNQDHAGDDACGTKPETGALHEFSSADDWRARFSGTSAPAFVCVTASGTPAAAAPALRAGARFQAADPQSAAIGGIAAYELDSLGPCAPFLKDPVAGTVTPVITNTANFSYVRILHQDGSYAGLARVQSDGTFLGVMVSGEEHPILTPAAMAALVAPKLVAHPPFAGRHDDSTPPRPAPTPKVTGPFWRPCRESPSPYYPLYQIEAEDVAGRPRTLWATFDGKVYSRLTWFEVPPPAESPIVRKLRRDDSE